MSSERQELTALKEKLGRNVDALKEQFDNALADYQSVVRTIQLLDSQSADVPQLPSPMPSASEIDFTGARNLEERLERIAIHGNGHINITKAAECLIEAKQSNSKKNNLRSMILRTVTQYPERWPKVAPGTFEWCNYTRDEPDDENHDIRHDSPLGEAMQQALVRGEGEYTD